MPDCQHIVDWLLGGAASQIGPDEVLSELCARLEGAGVPLWRVAVFVTTLHPDLLGRRFLWQAGRGVATSEALHAVADSDEFRVSPFATVYSSRRPLRRCFAKGAPADDYPVLKELISEGVTDYVAVPLAFSDGTVHVATFATRAPDGFAEADIAALDAVMLPFSRVAEIRALRRTAATLLGTYVGAQSGERILAGRIRLGDVEAIDAAIWLSDMRGFTSLSEHVSATELLGYLNRYFDCQVSAIHAQGGEVLKFMGDGLLAIFPLARDGADTAAVCARAVAAARQAEADIAALIPIRPDPEGRAARFGLALHIGQVLYGNVGGGRRLDFTCIGPAVNLASRLERIAGRLDRTIVASAQFAARLPGEFTALGVFDLPGFAEPQAAFALAR